MTTNGVSKHYDTLTDWERLPLIIAAAARKDEAERQRLIDSAPRLVFRVATCNGLAEGLERLAFVQMLVFLDYWAAFFAGVAAAGINEENLSGRTKKEARKKSDRIYGYLQMIAYRFTVEMDAWDRLCGELHIASDVLIRDLPGYSHVEMARKIMDSLAFSEEEATAFLTELHGIPTEADTVESSVAGMRQWLESSATHWT